MNRHIKTAAISAAMIIFSITATGVAEAGVGDCGELRDDCFTKAYIGITGGASSWSIPTLGTAPFVEVDTEDIAYGIVTGYRLNKFFGVELVGNYFGEPDYIYVATPMDVRLYNAGIGANFYLPLGEVISDPNLTFISLMGRGGMHYWDIEAEEAGVVVFEDDGVNLFWSLGLNLDLASHLAVRAEYSTYELGDSDEVSTKALTLIVKF